MYIKQIQDDTFSRVGFKMKLVFSSEDEYHNFYRKIKNSFSGIDSATNSAISELINAIDHGYVAEDMFEENTPPSTTIPSTMIAQLFLLFFSVLSLKVVEVPKFDEEKYIEREKYNALSGELTKANNFVRDLQQKTGLKANEEELQKLKAVAEENNSKIKKLEDENRAIKDSRDSAERRAKDASESADRYFSALKDTKEKYEALHNEHTKLVSSLATVQPKLDELVGKINALSNDFKNIEEGDKNG